MKRCFWIATLFSLLYSQPDFVCPIAIVRIGTVQNGLFDVLEVHSFLQNRGISRATSPLYPESYTAVTIGVDSFNIRGHSITILDPGYFIEFIDTIQVVAGPCSIHSHCDPIGIFQNNLNGNNDVYSYYVNYHPLIHYDTLTLVHYDTIHDTIHASSSNLSKLTISNQKVFSRVFNAIGQQIWEGFEVEGKIPQIPYVMGLHVLVQRDNRKLFKIAF